MSLPNDSTWLQAFKSFFRKILQNRLKPRTQIGILGKNELSHWDFS